MSHLLKLACLLLAPAVGGAQVPALPASPPPESAEPIVKLDPFEVQADPDTSYGALNSNSITQFNAAMDRLPISADIFTETFMKDVAAASVEDMIQTYSAGAGYTSGVDSSTSAVANQPGDRNGNAYIQLRGMQTPAMQRDGFMPVGAFGNPGSTGVGVTSNFDLERVEVVNGPQALLYGGGGAGGVINVVSKQARLDQAASGQFSFRIDQYGSKQGQLDTGAGGDRVAIRVALLNQTQDSRRIDIGGRTDGYYVQLALRASSRTTLRFNTQQTTFNRILPAAASLIAPTADPRNGLSLHTLLATGQAGAVNPATGAAYPAGAIDNGRLNWSNADSFAGWQFEEPVVNEYSSVTADTQCAKWLSTQVAAGYDAYRDDRINPGFSFYAPGGNGNNLAGWTAGLTPSDSWQPARTKAIRASALVTNDLFGGRVRSQTMLGWDFVRTDMGQIAYSWVQADSNWNALVTPGVTANAGYTLLSKQEWSVDNGPVEYPLFYPNAKRATVNGINYVKVLTNPVDPALISPADPTGAVLTSGNYILTKIFSRGLYGINRTQWLDGKLDTLAGFRAAESDEDRIQQASGSKVEWRSVAKPVSFNLGADYAIARWLHPYVSFSDSFNPPFLANAANPYNAPPKTAQGLGEEAGFKVNQRGGGLSGSLAFYRSETKNDLYQVSSTIASEIDPTGLNGGGGSAYVNVNRVSQGAQLALTAAPTRNWRMRLSAATVNGRIGGASVSYPQVYNDQFYENGQGQVTYADGTVVYVNPAFNSRAPVATSATAGAIPLTVTAMSTAGNAYYANPAPVSGAINSGSNVATVLKVVDPVHGPILTGATFLPIANYQLNAGLTGIAPPGIIAATRAGDRTVGYPEFSVNLTGVYTFSQGWGKGCEIGGTELLGWKVSDYYYYPNGITAATALTAPRTLYSLPVQSQFNLIAGYARKFPRVAWSTQLNVSNVFNHYEVLVLPGATTGYSTPASLNSTFNRQPRAYVWTNTVKF